MKKRLIIIGVVNIICLLIFGISAGVIVRLASSLESQNTAKRWSGDGTPYAQMSLFLEEANGIAVEDIYMNRMNIDKGLTDNAISGNAITLPDGTVREKGRLWTDAYSGFGRLSVSNGSSSADANAVFTGGDYFLFHPKRLLAGNYYSDKDLMKDRVVIDEDLAWQLFGGSNVDGMTVTVSGQTFLIAGVVRKEANKAAEKAYGERPRIYMHFEAASQLNRSLKITAYEACLPNHITGLGNKIFTEAVSPDENRSVKVENSARYSFRNLFDIILNFDTARSRTNAVVFPYFENAARIVETRAALALAFALAALAVPAVTALILLYLFLINRKAVFGKVFEGLKMLWNRVKYVKNPAG